MQPVVVFAGPSLSSDDRLRTGFAWRPPAAAGDLIGLLGDPPPIVCLIDGYFDWRPAPWHKEVLALLEAGTQVFGASSMGALRAAELDRFGMVGVGAIYRAFRAGRLTGDDEVALIHAPERLGWAPLSVPMVEVRATLVAACRAGLLNAPEARRIRATVHEIHFDSRDWPAMIRVCHEAGIVPGETVGRLADMHVPLKRLDALACLAAAVSASKIEAPAIDLPKTCFIQQLARQQGVELRQPGVRNRTL